MSRESNNLTGYSDFFKEIPHVRRQIERYVSDPEQIPPQLYALLKQLGSGAADEHDAAIKDLESLFDSEDDMYYMMDLKNYGLIRISPACEKLYGYTKEEYFKNPNIWAESILPEDIPIINSNIPLMHAGTPFTHSVRIQHRDKSVRWVEAKVYPIVNDEGKVDRIFGITYDITSRKEAEIELRKSEEKYRTILRYAADAILLLDKHSVITYANEAFQKLLGYDASDILGLSSLTLVHPDDWVIMDRHTKEVNAQPGVPVPVQSRRKKKDGTYIYCEGTAINLLGHEAVESIVVNFREIGVGW